MSKSCKIQLDRLFDHPLLENSSGKVPEKVEQEDNTAAKTCRVSRAPQKLDSFVCNKLSERCPGCRASVKDGEDGVVCEKCKAYWHYGCAKVTQEEIDNQWKEEFVCEAHRVDSQKSVSFSKVLGNNTSQSISGNSGDEEVLVNIKINTYAIDKLGLIKFKLNKMDTKTEINEKACQRQHTIKVNSATYQILVENFVSFGDRLGVKPKRHDIDSKGDCTQDQYEMSLGNSIPVSVTYYHTTNNIMVQLKADKELKGAKKAAKTTERIQQLRHFVNDNLRVLINEIENDNRYATLKIQMTSTLKELLSNYQDGDGFQDCIPQGRSQETESEDLKLSPQKSIGANTGSGSVAGSPSKTPRRKGGKRCNEDCDKVRASLNQRVSSLEKERIKLQQKHDTLEKHQESLRSTISNKEGLIEAQTKLINDHLKTINSQKQLIRDMEIKSATHSELASSFLDVMMTEEGEENDSDTVTVKGNNLLQQMHDKIKELQSQVTDNNERMIAVEKERDSFQASVADLKEKLTKKTKEVNGFKTQLSAVEESVLSKENELKSLQTKLSDSDAKTESLLIDNTRLGSTLAEAERKVDELTEKVESLQAVENSTSVINQLTKQLKEKDFEIADLKETAEFTEKSANDRWKEEAAAGKRLQGFLNEEKKLRVHLEEECTILQAKLAEEKVKLERYKELLKLAQTDTTTEKANSKETTAASGLVSEKSEEERVPNLTDRQGIDVISSSSGNPPCIFELKADGACLRKEKCKFDHKLASSLRNNPDSVNKILVEISKRTGKCGFEMTQRGSCPGASTCNTSHTPSHPENQDVLRRICFRELMKKGSCTRGDKKCRFSHKISDEERANEDLVHTQRKVKDEKASKCVNEFRREGCCWRKDQCPFSHNISEADRNNEALKKSMDERVGIIKKKKERVSVESSQDTVQNPMEFMKSMLSLKQEFMEMMEKMKDNVRP